MSIEYMDSLEKEYKKTYYYLCLGISEFVRNKDKIENMTFTSRFKNWEDLTDGQKVDWIDSFDKLLMTNSHLINDL